MKMNIKVPLNMSGDASTTRTLKLAGGLKQAVSGSRDGANLICDMETVAYTRA